MVAILLSVASYLFGLSFASTVGETVSLMLLLVGLWTIVAAFVIIDHRDRAYYGGWGVVLAVLSVFAYIQPGYALGVLLIAIVLLILIMALAGRGGHVLTAATTAPTPAGDTPAANPTRRSAENLLAGRFLPLSSI